VTSLLAKIQNSTFCGILSLKTCGILSIKKLVSVTIEPGRSLLTVRYHELFETISFPSSLLPST